MATVGGRTGNLPDDQAAQNGVASEEERRYPSRFIWIASPSKCVFDKIHDGVSRRIEKIDVVVKILNSAPDQAVDVVLFLAFHLALSLTTSGHRHNDDFRADLPSTAIEIIL